MLLIVNGGQFKGLGVREKMVGKIVSKGKQARVESAVRMTLGWSGWLAGDL